MFSSVHHDLRESIPMHMHMTILSRIYTYIHVYIYIYKYIHTPTYTYILELTAYAQYRHVQRCCPRHQLYEILSLSADSCPRYHLNEVVSSGVVPAISFCMTSEIYPRTSLHAHFADCELLCSLPNELSTGAHTAGSNFACALKCIAEYIDGA